MWRGIRSLVLCGLLGVLTSYVIGVVAINVTTDGQLAFGSGAAWVQRACLVRRPASESFEIVCSPRSDTRFDVQARALLASAESNPFGEPFGSLMCGNEASMYTSFTLDTAGWPLRCMWRWRVESSHLDMREGEPTGGAVLVARSRAGRWPSADRRAWTYAIPYSLRGWGMAGDMALWGVAWWVAMYGSGVMRRAIRKRRGACAVCGYDLRGSAAGSVCPECGNGR